MDKFSRNIFRADEKGMSNFINNIHENRAALQMLHLLYFILTKFSLSAILLSKDQLWVIH